MKYLLLQKDYAPSYVKDAGIAESFTFSGGEDHVIIPQYISEYEHITMVSRVNSSSDLMKVVLAKDALDRMGVEKVSLHVPCLPYARQDRVMQFGEPLSISVFARIINGCNFHEVETLDPHSDVSKAVINRLKVNYYRYDTFLRNVFAMETEECMDEICLVSPDAGAEKKVYRAHQALNLTCGIINCGKTRNENREITGTRVYGEVKDKVCFIVDDICDGGRTFVALTDKLKEMGAKRVVLIVTHGIFSYGEEQLSNIDRIYSTTSWRSMDSKKITFINI